MSCKYTKPGPPRKITSSNEEDERLVINCQKLTGLTADLLGLSHYFDCPLPSAVSIPNRALPGKSQVAMRRRKISD